MIVKDESPRSKGVQYATGEKQGATTNIFRKKDMYWSKQNGQVSLRRNGVALIINKRVWNAVLGCNLRNGRKSSVCFQGKSFNIRVIQVYAPTINAEEPKGDEFYEDLEDPLELTPKKKKKHPVDHRVLECKSKKSRDTWSNSQVGLGIQSEAGQRILTRECSGHRKYPFQQHERWLYTWTSPNGQYWNQTDYIFCSWRWRTCIISKNKTWSRLWFRSLAPHCKVQA